MATSTTYNLSLLTPTARAIIDKKVKKTVPVKKKVASKTTRQEVNEHLFRRFEPSARRLAKENDPDFSLFEASRPVMDAHGALVKIEVDYSTKPKGDLKTYVYESNN